MTILIIIEVILAILLVVLVLLQTSDNEGLGLGGGSGLGGLMTARGTANFLTRATSITATLFMIMSIILTIAASSNSEKKILNLYLLLKTLMKVKKLSLLMSPQYQIQINYNILLKYTCLFG